MIAKERLEELIEQGATIYINKYKYIGQCLLNNRMSCNNSIICFDDKDDGEIEFLINLFETKEEAEWHKEFGCIERTERLDLPTWEEFIEMEEVVFWKKNHRQTIIRVLGTKYIVVETSYERFFTGDLTKESYIKACRKAKELFLGGNK